MMELYNDHISECRKYGIPPLSYNEYVLCLNHNVPESELYSVACDLYCMAFINIYDAIGYYMESEQ